jgi:hypothetical protein
MLIYFCASLQRPFSNYVVSLYYYLQAVNQTWHLNMSGAFSRTAKIIPMKGDIVIEPQGTSKNGMMNSSLLRHGRRAPGYPGESLPFKLQIELHSDAFDTSFDPIVRNEIVCRVEHNLRDKGLRFLMYDTSLSTYVHVTDLETVRREIFFALMNHPKTTSSQSFMLNNRLESALGNPYALQRSLIHQHDQTNLRNEAENRRRLVDQQQQHAHGARKRKVKSDIVDLTDDPEEEKQGGATVPKKKNNIAAAAPSYYDSLMDGVAKQHQKQQQPELHQKGSAADTTKKMGRPTRTLDGERWLENAEIKRKREAKIKAISDLRDQTGLQQEETLRRYCDAEDAEQLSGQSTGQNQHSAQAGASGVNAGTMPSQNHAGSTLNQYSAAMAAVMLHQQQQQQARNVSSQFAGFSLPFGVASGLSHSAGLAARGMSGLLAFQQQTAAANQIQQHFLSNSVSATTHLPASHAKKYNQHFFKKLKINDLPSKCTNEMSGWQFFPMNLEKDLKNLPLLNEWRIVVTPMSGNLDRSFTVDPSNVLPTGGR